jgi:hypothetical protein
VHQAKELRARKSEWEPLLREDFGAFKVIYDPLFFVSPASLPWLLSRFASLHLQARAASLWAPARRQPVKAWLDVAKPSSDTNSPRTELATDKPAAIVSTDAASASAATAASPATVATAAAPQAGHASTHPHTQSILGAAKQQLQRLFNKPQAVVYQPGQDGDNDDDQGFVDVKRSSLLPAGLWGC